MKVVHFGQSGGEITGIWRCALFLLGRTLKWDERLEWAIVERVPYWVRPLDFGCRETERRKP